MFEYKISDHARTRMSQRGIRNEDVGIVQIFGTKAATDVCPETGASRDIYLLKHADANREIDNLKDEIKWIERMKKLKVMRGSDAIREISARKHGIRSFERLRNLKVVMQGSVVITCYWSCVSDQRETFRRGRASK